MRDYMAVVCVVLPKATRVRMAARAAIVLAEMSATARHEPDEMMAIGYYRNIAVRAGEDHVKHVLEAFVQDGEIHWGETAWHEMKPHEIPADAREGVWYAGTPDYFSHWS